MATQSETRWAAASKAALGLGLWLLVLGCSGQHAPVGGTQPAVLTNQRPTDFLPKQDATPTRPSGKADIFDDFRLFFTDQFKITAPPTQSGFRAPGEFEPQQLLLVGWIDGVLDTFFTQIIKGAWGTTTILLIDHRDSGTFNYDVRASMKQKLVAAGLSETEVNDPTRLKFIEALNDSVWARDYGPQAIIHGSGKLSFVDTRYYNSRPFDDKIPTELADALGINVFRPSLRIEGGNIQSNGKGDCFATRGVVYRNLPDPDEAGSVARIKQYLGCQNLYLLNPLEGEATTHLDMFMMVIGERDIVVGEYLAADDCINRELLEKNVALLKQISDNGQQKYRIWRIPMPPNSDGIWRTYTNLQMVRGAGDPSKGVVLLPVYKNLASYESEALATLQQAFAAAYAPPNSVSWSFVTIDSDAIIPANGAIHCVVHEVSAATLGLEQSAPAGLCEQSETPHNCQQSGCVGPQVSIDGNGLCDGNNRIRCVSGSVRMEPCASPCVMRSDTSLACETSCSVVNGQALCADPYLCKEASCTNQCFQGETGCNADGTQRYSCSVGASGCLERTYAACPNETSCINGSCVATNNCGDVDFVGQCEGNTVVWCEDNELFSINCSTSNALCGFSPEFAYYMCLSGSSCTDECQPGEQGCDGNIAWVCQPSQTTECYIKAKSPCADSTCRNGVCCVDDCNSGEIGCSLDKTQRWTCGADGQGCLKRQHQPCDGNTSCDAGSCVQGCSDDCSVGQTGCGDDNKTVWTCKSGPLGCLIKSPTSSCGTNEVCDAGACIKSCKNACEANSKGCEEGKQASWVCVSDADGCRTKQITTCPPGQECRNGQCQGGSSCDNECELGDRGCHQAGISAWICATPKDSLCTLKVTVPCGFDEVCDKGTCVPAPQQDVSTPPQADMSPQGDTGTPGPGGGSAGCSTQSQPEPPAPLGLLFSLLVFWGWRRRRAA